MLEPNRDQIEIFLDAIFRHAGQDGFVSLRAFYEDDSSKPFRVIGIGLSGGFSFLAAAAEDDARRAAQFPKPVVFCPPLAVFASKDHAREQDILRGLALSVECDEHPQKAREALESLLGPATLVVRSGGRFINGGAPEDKLHLHWRLKTPASGAVELAKLKEARALATRLVGGDASNVPPCHPIRWPGSWHRKAEPRLCEIEHAEPDVEIGLDNALAKLKAAAPAPDAGTAGGDAGNGDPQDWDQLVADIISGTRYHASLVSLAARCVGAGMHDGQTVKLLRSIMHAVFVPQDARWQTRFQRIPSIVTSAREKYTQANAPKVPLAFGNMAGWDARPAPDRQWGVLDRIPLLQPTLFSGEGAAGKTIVELQLCVAHVLGRDWLGSMPEPGPAIYFGAEDDLDELHRRLALIVEFYGAKFADLIAGGLHLLSLAGEDAVLAAPDRTGKLIATPLYDRLLEAVSDIRPKHIGIDTTADTFGGNEIDRVQVRQYVGMLRRLAIAANGSVVALAHPSLTGISSGTGLSGSTGWHNSVRARMYLRSPKAADEDQPDSDLRELQFLKNNYGRVADSVVLRFRNGLFLPEAGQSPLEKLAREQRIDEVFLDVLGKLIRQNRPVSPSAHASNYGPKLIAAHPGGKAYTQREYQAALERLLAANRVHVASFGPRSKPVRHLAIGAKAEGA